MPALRTSHLWEGIQPVRDHVLIAQEIQSLGQLKQKTVSAELHTSTYISLIN